MENSNPKTPVTCPTFPPLEQYIGYLEEIWKSKQLTNFGKFARELEEKIKNYIGTKNCQYVTNGTLALQLAIKALDLKGEIITTPFSFVATSSAIYWEGCQPILVDIDLETLNIDPKKIEAAITPKTSAILATHVYGNPCAIDELEAICEKHNLKLIFDAAHSFGSKFMNKSLLDFGDISTTSFHATKVFHTVEGGLVVFRNDEIGRRLDYMRNYGFRGAEDFQGLGINVKCSELHAAMGLCLLPGVHEAIGLRLAIHDIYDKVLKPVKKLKFQAWDSRASKNGAYYPIIFESEGILLKVQGALRAENILPRRYFYPSLSRLEYVKYQDVSIAESVASRVLCLPVYPDLPTTMAEKIAGIVLKCLS